MIFAAKQLFKIYLKIKNSNFHRNRYRLMQTQRLSRLKQSIKSKEGKNLLANFFSLSLLQVAAYIFPLITLPYLAKVIGINYFGEIAFASAVMVYLSTIVDYGFVFSGVRDIARVRDDLDAVSEIYSRIMWSRFVLVGISFIILTALIICVPQFYEKKAVLYATFLLVIGTALFPDWMFQALEKMKYITIFNVLVKLLFTVSVFIFIKKPEDYLLQPILTSLGYIVSGICSMWLINKWGIRMYRPGLRKIKESIKSNFDLFLNQIVPNLYNSMSVLLLGFFHGNAANALFDVGNRFTTAGVSFFNIISRTFFPFLSRKMSKHTFYLKLNVVLSLLMSVAMFIAAPWPKDFTQATGILRILSVSIFFLAMTNVFGTNYLILKKQEKKQRTITVWTSIIGFAMSIPFVYFGSATGAALVILISRMILAIWSAWESKKLMKLEANPGNILN